MLRCVSSGVRLLSSFVPARSTLYVVATPIGNLDDITLRAVKVLGAVDCIAAEDTRNTLRLLSAVGVTGVPIYSCHEHNAGSAVPHLISRLQAGAAIALVSDAGTPVLSDPGQHLIEACTRNGFAVTPVPGASAVTAALSVSGFPGSTESGFVFLGFFPRKPSDRARAFSWLLCEPKAAVWFEAPTRIQFMLGDLASACGAVGQSGRRVLVARELTKLHEELFRGTVAQASVWAAAHAPRGEFTVVLEGASGKLALAQEVPGASAHRSFEAVSRTVTVASGSDDEGTPSSASSTTRSFLDALVHSALVPSPILPAASSGGVVTELEPESDLEHAVRLVDMLVASGEKTPVAVKCAAAATGVKKSVLYMVVANRKAGAF